MNYRIKTFNNIGDITIFFQKLGYQGFPDWFNSNIAGRENWKTERGPIRLKNPTNWQEVWSNCSIIFGKDTFNLVEFLCMNSIIMNETGGTFIPLTENVNGSSGHPGISYAFDTISGIKMGYNTLSTNRTAYDLFNDSNFKSAHVTKPLGSVLKDTKDTRWGGIIFPQGFSGNISNETSVLGKTNTFITEADFMKFRGRGYIQTTGRRVYYYLIDFILSYSGKDDIINSIKNSWMKYGTNKDVISSISTNSQWDDLFQKTNSVIANYAVHVHSISGGAIGKKNYQWIDATSSDTILNKNIKQVALAIAGAYATAYSNTFYARVMQQLNLIESSNLDTIGGPTFSNITDVNNVNSDDKEEKGSQDITNNNGDNQLSPWISNISQPTVKPKQIKFDLPPQPDQQSEIAKSLGNIPFVWYNSYQIHPSDISFLKVSTGSELPTIKIIFRDSLNLMKDKAFPLDDSIISVFINPRTDQLKPIHMDFKIIKFSMSEDTYIITGTIDVSKLYIKSYKSLSNMTSFEALHTIANDCGLGFATNIDNTDDRMTWINTGVRNYEFVDMIVEASYKSDETFLLCYIDLYYNLTYVDLEKELNRDIAKELGVANIGIEDVVKLDNQERVRKLFLTNDFSAKNSNNYFVDYRIINNSTLVSLEDGYLTRVKFYDEIKKDFLIFDVDSITSKGDQTIIMKGSPQDEEFFNKNIQLIYAGKMDSDNMHKNYHYSFVQNDRNISELTKVGIEIKMKTPNYNLYKFQKVYIFLSNQASTPSQSHINNRLTGDWFIIDINYEFDGSLYSQVIKLIKRELSLSPEELGNEPPQQSKNIEVGDKTSNDTNTSSIDTSIPNDITSGILSGYTSSVPIDYNNFPLTKDIFRSIYSGKINNKVIELFYDPMRDSLIKYSINTKERISAFLSQVNAETGFLLSVTEYASGNEYEGRSDLGNTNTGDGSKFKGRGLIQLTGRKNYKETGKFLNRDYLSDPMVVSADNNTHRRASDTSEQIENTILTAIRYWLKGSSWGNLNTYADLMDIKKPMGLGSSVITDLPNTQKDGVKYGNKKRKNFARTYSPNDENFNNFTIICFGVNGGYNGYRDRVNNWNQIREYFK
jgi:predicted chitinase